MSFSTTRLLVLLSVIGLLASACVSIPSVKPNLPPAPEPAPVVDRISCDQIYGTAFRSEQEQEWFLQNCSQWGAIDLSPVQTPQPPIGNVTPNQQERAGTGAATQGTPVQNQPAANQRQPSANNPAQNSAPSLPATPRPQVQTQVPPAAATPANQPNSNDGDGNEGSNVCSIFRGIRANNGQLTRNCPRD
jgi:hypothetical protein